MSGQRAVLVTQLGILFSTVFLSVPFCSADPVQSTVPTEEEKRAETITALQRLTDEGLQYQKAGQFEAAIEKYKAALVLAQDMQYNPIIAALSSLLGSAYVDLRRWQEAVEAYEQAVRIKPGDVTTYAALGATYSKLGRYREAAEAFKQATRIKPDYALAYEGLGLAYDSLSLWQEAVEAYQQAIRIKPDYAPAYEGLGLAYKNLGRYQEAAEAFKEAIRLKPDDAAMHVILGMVYREFGRYQEAIEAFKQAIRIEPNFAEAYVELGMAYGKLGSLQEAMETFKQAIRIKPDYAEAYNNLCWAYRNKGRWQDAIQACKQAIHIKPDDAKAYYNLGIAYSKLGRWPPISLPPPTPSVTRSEFGRWQEAIDAFKQAIRINPDFADAYGGLGRVYDELGRWQEAAEAYKQVIRLKPNDASAYSMLGWTYVNLGHWQDAADAFKQAHQIKPDDYSTLSWAWALEETGRFSEAMLLYQEQHEDARERKDIRSEVLALMTLAHLSINLGDKGSALKYFRQALKLQRQTRNLLEEASILMNTGILQHYMEQYNDALHSYHQALSKFQEIEDRKSIVWVLKRIGIVYFLVGDHGRALRALNQALQIHQQFPQSRVFSWLETADLFFKLGEVYAFSGQYEEALGALQRAETIAGRLNTLDLTGSILYLKGLIQQSRGQFQEALTLYIQAAETRETFISQEYLEERKISFRSRVYPVYQNIISLLFRLHMEEPEQNYTERAFFYHEKSKARTLLDLLEEAKTRIREGIDPALLKEEERLSIRISHLHRALANPVLPREQEKQLLATLEEQNKAYQALRVKMAVDNPKYAELTSPQVAGIPEVQAILDKETLLLEYALGEEKSFLWRVTQDGMQAYELPAQKDLTQRLEHYLPTLREPLYGQDEIERHIELGRELFRILLGPAADQLQGKSKLIIVPDGSLYYLPFEALIADKGNTDSKQGKEQLSSIPYLVKDHTITYTPSASVLVALEKDRNTNRHKKASSQAPLLAFGDPVYQYQTAPEPPTLALNLRRSYEERGGGFPRLEYSAEEVKKIAGIYGITPPSDAVNLRERATEKRLRELLDLSHYRVLHFATHAILSDEVKWITQPALVLSLAGVDDTHDGFLQMGEIFNLRLDADLVVLSACDTGRGKLYRGEGVVGLTRAFMYAGTPSVVASLWKVNDQSTSLFMEFFYRSLKDGQTKTEALRQAKKQLMQTQVWSDILEKEQSLAAPYFWAPFILVGSGS